MTASLSHYGRTFATRERGRALAEEVLLSERAYSRDATVTIDLTDTVTAPSFLQGFLRRLAQDTAHITLTGAHEKLVPMIGRITNHIGLADKVDIEREVPA